MIKKVIDYNDETLNRSTVIHQKILKSSQLSNKINEKNTSNGKYFKQELLKMVQKIWKYLLNRNNIFLKIITKL